MMLLVSLNKYRMALIDIITSAYLHQQHVLAQFNFNSKFDESETKKELTNVDQKTVAMEFQMQTH